MDLPDEMRDDIVSLSQYSTTDACYWLLHKLHISQHLSNAYTAPFMSYVLTWPNAVPLTTIIMAQNPYPNDIYSPISAAMSYSERLCISIMKRLMPPTVEVLVNDLYVNASLPKETSVNILKHGWTLVEDGVLLVNEGVFHKQSDVEYFEESADQCNVIIRLLEETEKYGKRTVNVFALGEAGERMASNLCSWYKSDIIRLTKRKATHPAGVARRFDNLQDPRCTLGSPSFSKALAKCFSNCVASMHIMGKQSEVEIRIRRQSDAIKSVGQQFPQLAAALDLFISLQQKIEMATNVNSQEYKETLAMLIKAGTDLSFRLNVAAAVTQNIEQNSAGVSSYVAKGGPSLSTVTPSEKSLSQHVGNDYAPVPSRGVKAIKLNLSGSKKPLPIVAPEPTRVSSAPSIVSTTNTTPVKSIKLNLTKTPTKSANSTTEQSTQLSTTSEVSTVSIDQTDIPTTSSLGARFRNVTLTQGSNKLGASGEKSKGKEGVSSSSFALSKEHVNQLSSVEAVVLTHKPDAKDNPELSEIFDLIQHDISYNTMYNAPVTELVAAIKEDIKNIDGFDFIEWALDDTKQSKVQSKTYIKCQELFEF